MQEHRPKLSYANVMSTVGVFLALGGVGLAASQLPKNSVGPKQLKANAVTGTKVKDDSLTGKDVSEASLGSVPSASDADKLGGAAASTFLKGADSYPGTGALTGTHTNPSLADQSVDFDNLNESSRAYTELVLGSSGIVIGRPGVSTSHTINTGIYCFDTPVPVQSVIATPDIRNTGLPLAYSTVDPTTISGLGCTSPHDDAAVETWLSGSLHDEFFSVLLSP